MATRQYLTQLPVGFGFCPCCCEAFDLTGRRASFSIPYCKRDLMVFVLCETCDIRFQSAAHSMQKQVATTSFGHVSDPPEGPNLFAVTTLITLWWNGGDLVRAFELGHDLPQPVYEALANGECSMTRLPGAEVLDLYRRTGGRDGSTH